MRIFIVIYSLINLLFQELLLVKLIDCGCNVRADTILEKCMRSSKGENLKKNPVVLNFCVSTQLSEIVKESAFSCNYFFPLSIPHKSTKLKKNPSKMCGKKFLLYEIVNSNSNLIPI